MRRFGCRILWLGCLVLLAPHSAAATTIRVSFSGTIDQFYETPGATDGSVNVGTQFFGWMTFDDAAPDGDSRPGIGDYYFSSPPWVIAVQLGSFTLGSVEDPYWIEVFDFDDVFRAVSLDFAVAGPGNVSQGDYLDLVLIDDSRSALFSDALANVPFDLTAWSRTGFSVFVRASPGGFAAYGHLDALSTVVVPEPCTSTLFAIGVALLALRSRHG
jgi:hypothetical protein